MSGLDNLNSAFENNNIVDDIVAPIPSNERLDLINSSNVIGASSALNPDLLSFLQPQTIDEYLVDDNSVIPIRSVIPKLLASDRPLLSTENSFTVNASADADLLAHRSGQPDRDSLAEAISLSSSLLEKFLNQENFETATDTAFGNGWDTKEAIALIKDLIAQKALPEIKVLPVATLQALGAFDGKKIYLSQELLDSGKTYEIAAVFLEEIGHYLDSKLNTTDSIGDEGEIFSKLVRDLILDENTLAQLREENDRGVFNLDGQDRAIEKADLESGIFTVGSSGEFTVDLMADAGSYKGELAVFSLNGMSNLTPGSTEYIFEAARRALSNSAQGHLIINDSAEGAHFTGELGEVEKNEGKYAGKHTVSFAPGERVALMLVPTGTVQAVFDNPTAEGDIRPLFSIAAANPGGKEHLGQLVEGTFVWEDLRFDNGSDADYNDIIIQVKGATGAATNVEQLMDVSRDWRATETGKLITDFVADIAPPVISVNLQSDTGNNSTDKITNDPTLSAQITDTSQVNQIEASINDGEQPVNITEELQPDGSLTLDRDRLTQIAGDELPDGDYEVTITATDDKDNTQTTQTSFTLDTSSPEAPSDITVDNNNDLTTDNKKPERLLKLVLVIVL
jgi:Domain of unknown function (DUF4114)/Bacterial Ig-like domain